MPSAPRIRVIGVDPGSHITGYGLIEREGNRLIHVDNGCLVAPTKALIEDRLFFIFEGLVKVLKEFKPHVMALEEAFYAKSVASTLRLGEARGIILLAARSHDIPVTQYATRSVKQAVTAYGQATKEQVQEMTRRLLNLREVAQEDASDALALAICHAHGSTLSALSPSAKKSPSRSKKTRWSEADLLTLRKKS